MPADIRARFGLRLRNLRKKKGWTQVELADYLGLRRTYISDLERGKRNVSLLTMEIIARGFKLSVSQLLRGL
jgi:transcriptional regulator with XRE-family HTH domain